MNEASTPRLPLSRGLPLRPAVLIATLTLLLVGGCSYSARERYFDDRAAVVHPSQGDGSRRLSLWPGAGIGRTTLAAGGGSRTDEPAQPVLPEASR
jgi:hypothetical protein